MRTSKLSAVRREELESINKVFYCQLCNKQYQLAAEYEVHLSSYDHNHKQRFVVSAHRLLTEGARCGAVGYVHRVCRT